MTRDELVQLVQKLDQQGASEQEINIVVEGYRSEMTSPVKHTSETDPNHNPYILHGEEEETPTTQETPTTEVKTPEELVSLSPEELAERYADVDTVKKTTWRSGILGAGAEWLMKSVGDLTLMPGMGHATSARMKEKRVAEQKLEQKRISDPKFQEQENLQIEADFNYLPPNGAYATPEYTPATGEAIMIRKIIEEGPTRESDYKIWDSYQAMTPEEQKLKFSKLASGLSPMLLTPSKG